MRLLLAKVMLDVCDWLIAGVERSIKEQRGAGGTFTPGPAPILTGEPGPERIVGIHKINEKARYTVYYKPVKGRFLVIDSGSSDPAVVARMIEREIKARIVRQGND